MSSDNSMSLALTLWCCMSMCLLLDDSWINITPDQLDDMLSKMAGRPITDAGSMAETVKAFVDKVSSHEGVDFAGYESLCFVISQALCLLLVLWIDALFVSRKLRELHNLFAFLSSVTFAASF